MLTEGIGGWCPNCRYDKTLFRYGSSGHLHMQACPNCGFAVADNLIDETWSAKEVFECLFEIEGVSTLEELKQIFEEQAPEEHDDEIDYIFNLSNEEIKAQIWIGE